MVIDFKKLTAAELTEVCQDLSKILTKNKRKRSTEAVYNFWHELLRGIIRESDIRIARDIENEQ